MWRPSSSNYDPAAAETSAASSVGAARNSFGASTSLAAGASTSLGCPSSSFLAAAVADSSEFRTEDMHQGSSDSGNFIKASQPTTSVLGIPERDRRLIKARYAPKSALRLGGAAMTSSRVAVPMNPARRRNSEQQQHRHVMARLNATGSQVRETQIPSFIVVNTPYSKTKRRTNTDAFNPRMAYARGRDRGHHRGQDRGHERGHQGAQNQNNASAENGRFSTADADGPGQDEAMDVAAWDSSSSTPSQLLGRVPTQVSTQTQPPPTQQQSRQQRRKQTQSSANGDTNRNAANDCHCVSKEKRGTLSADKTTDIVPPRRPRARVNEAKNFEEDCGDSPWSWHVDASWGCQKYPEVYYCDEDCPSLLEYLLCPEDEDCHDEDEDIEWTTSADDVDLEAVITLRQGESDEYEVRNLNVTKKGRDDFTVSWMHPPGVHPLYAVVVYPPIEPGAARPHGPDCGPCAEEDECICASEPIFRMHVDGAKTSCDFPIECLQAGKSFIVEVATLNKARNTSFGTSLLQIDVYEVKESDGKLQALYE